MSIRGGYGLSYDRLMNLPAENYRNSPPLRATVDLGQFFGTPQFTYSLGDASKPYLGYPVDPALQVGLDSRNGIIGARVDLTTVDPSLRSPFIHNWFAGVQRELWHGIVADVELRRIGRPEPAQRVQHQSLRRRPDRRPIRRLQSELRPGQHGHLDVDLRLQRRHADAAAELRAGVHAAGGLHVRAREGRCGSCSGDDELPGRSRSAGRAGAGELRRDAQARDGRRLADAVLQGQHRHHEECAGGLATRRVCDPSDRDADQHHQWGVLSSG